jgi:hypothetical protein
MGIYVEDIELLFVVMQSFKNKNYNYFLFPNFSNVKI